MPDPRPETKDVPVEIRVTEQMLKRWLAEAVYGGEVGASHVMDPVWAAQVFRQHLALLERERELVGCLEEIRDIPCLGFVQCAWIDTRQTGLPDPSEVMGRLMTWEKKADRLTAPAAEEDPR